jgi:hypothetical protein
VRASEMVDCDVVAQYADGAAAVTHALRLVVTYMLRVQAHDEVAREYAPLAVRGHAREAAHPPGSALLVFDIDDTLLFDVGEDAPRAQTVIPHQDVVDLMRRTHQLGAEIHLVTARLNDREMVAETRHELERLGLDGLYASLTLAPARARTSMAAVSRWKMAQRRRIASERRCAVTLTVGDQWGDMVALDDDDDIDMLDDRFAAHTMPYILVRPRDTVSLWGLKLPAYT